MTVDAAKDITHQALKFLEGFVFRLDETEKALLPEVLQHTASLTAACDGLVLAVFCLDLEETERVEEYQKKGWHLFPGFITSENRRSADEVSVAFNVHGKCHFFSSNQSSGNFAFSVSPDSSFTVVDHVHEIVGTSGEKLTYRVPLAFVLGLNEGEEWPEIEARLSELLAFSLDVWKKV